MLSCRGGNIVFKRSPHLNTPIVNRRVRHEKEMSKLLKLSKVFVNNDTQ